MSNLVLIFLADTVLQLDATNGRPSKVLDTPYTAERRISTYERKLLALKLKLRAEKESKRKMKRKLKIKMAQKVNKLKERLSAKKRKVLKLKEGVKKVTDSAINDNEISAYATVNDVEIEFAANPTNADGSVPNWQPVQNVNVEEIANDEFDVRFFHSYSKPYVSEPVRVYECQYCGYKTPKKDNLVKHIVSCISMKVRDEICPVCEKSFTYDGLRGHLRYYAIGNYIAKTKHAQYTPQEHKTMLEYHKMKKIK